MSELVQAVVDGAARPWLRRRTSTDSGDRPGSRDGFVGQSSANGRNDGGCVVRKSPIPRHPPTQLRGPPSCLWLRPNRRPPGRQERSKRGSVRTRLPVGCRAASVPARRTKRVSAPIQNAIPSKIVAGRRRPTCPRWWGQCDRSRTRQQQESRQRVQPHSLPRLQREEASGT